MVKPLGDSQAGLVVDETGFHTQGRHAAGVARQDRGPAGRVEPSHSGVCLGDASPQGPVVLDRVLSLPQAWPHDAARCQGAESPAELASRRPAEEIREFFDNPGSRP